jgi:hypothetical protein
MHWIRGLTLAAAALAALTMNAVAAEDGVEIDCQDTNLAFEAPGFTVNCKDYSRNSVSGEELNAGMRTYTLFAVSEADLTFLHVYSNRILGGTRIYFTKRSLESQIEDAFTAKFTDWGDEDDLGDFEVKHVTAAFKNDDPVECLAFRKMGARRHEGVAGMTVGFACSASGRDHAFTALKRFAGES